MALGFGVALALVWGAFALRRGGAEYGSDVITYQTAGRLVGGFAHRHAFWFYLVMLPVLLLPWSAWPAVWKAVYSALRTGLRDGTAFIEVEDNGPGIAPADRGRVFERFDRGSAPRGSGSGLGLSIVRDIALRHAGSVELLDGAEGRGLLVRVRLPVAAEAL